MIIENEVIYCDVLPVAMFKMATRVLAQNGEYSESTTFEVLFLLRHFESNFLTESCALKCSPPTLIWTIPVESCSLILVQPLNDRSTKTSVPMFRYNCSRVILISKQTDHCTDEAAVNTRCHSILFHLISTCIYGSNSAGREKCLFFQR